MDEESPPVFVLGCVQCGKTVGGSEKTCPRCGASFEDVRFECPFCGALVSVTDSKCDSCGTEFALFAEEVSDATSVDLDGPNPPEAEEETAPQKCSQCGEPLPEGAESCPKCQKPEEDYECPACGGRVSEKDEVCPSCGARFE